MADQTLAALRRIKAHADTQGAVIDRVEVALNEGLLGSFVEFTAHLLPKPLDESKACTGYFVETEKA